MKTNPGRCAICASSIASSSVAAMTFAMSRRSRDDHLHAAVCICKDRHSSMTRILGAFPNKISLGVASIPHESREGSLQALRSLCKVPKLFHRLKMLCTFLCSQDRTV